LPAERARASLISRPRSGSLLIVSSSEVPVASLAVASCYRDVNLNPGRFINREALQVQCIGQFLGPTLQTWTWPLGAVCFAGYPNGSCANCHYNSDGAYCSVCRIHLATRQLQRTQCEEEAVDISILSTDVDPLSRIDSSFPIDVHPLPSSMDRILFASRFLPSSSTCVLFPLLPSR
jgi:hypothetical protein